MLKFETEENMNVTKTLLSLNVIGDFDGANVTQIQIYDEKLELVDLYCYAC